MATSKETKQVDKEAGTAAAKPETAAELQEKIKGQVEYYLSRQNLLQDSYLVGQMDKDHFVDIAVIAEFNLIKQLTTDLDLILASVKNSDQIVIDEARRKIKPVTFNQRTTLILRNIPTDASKESVEKLLSSVSLPKILSLRPDVGDNWFATFETEETTKTALELVKGLKWEEKRISAAIKSENILKGVGAAASSSVGLVNAFYVPVNVQPNGYVVSNGQYNFSYQAPGEGAATGYRGGRGGMGGRRGAGAGGVAVSNGAAGVGGEVCDNGRRTGPGKKKGRGVREGGGREAGGDSSRLPGSALPSGGKDVPQGSINLADFPILEAKGGKKDSDGIQAADASKSPNGHAEVQRKDSASNGDSSNSNSAAAAAAPSAEVDHDGIESQGNSGSAPPKKSYAQMALANAALSAGVAASGSQAVPAPSAVVKASD